MIKPYLCFMAGKNEYDNIYELVNDVKPYIRGVCALIHDANEFDAGASYLLKVNNELGAGNIIFGSYIGDHSHSRNRILKETGIEFGDFIVMIDLMERIPVDFAKSFNDLISQMENQNIDIAYYYNKPYVIRYREDLLYINTPHESLININILGKKLKNIELNNFISDESKVRINTRPLKRDKNHHISHYIRYLLQPNSNQNLLGIEYHPNLERYEFLRESLVKELKKRKLPRTVDGVKTLLSEPLNEITRPMVNEHGQINRFYRFYILGHTDIIDSHTDWDNLPKF